jgi:N-acetyl-gamma-glutamyl-phosphate reductase
VLDVGVTPETRSVKGSNFCQIAVQKAPDSNKLIVISVIDNLVFFQRLNRLLFVYHQK